MKRMFRVIVLFFVVPATYYFIYWLPCSLLPLGGQRWIATVLSLLGAIAAGRYVWVKTASVNDGAISAMSFGALLVGGIGFAGGFFGPMIFTPEANQGPLLGIFITGPIGFLVGGIGGLLYWTMKGRN